MSQALGIIETLGLAAAVEAADTAVKSANVRLIGYEKTKGGGWITVKFTGDVGAVGAAISASVKAAEKVNQVIGTLILARPHEDLELLIHSGENFPGKPKDGGSPPAPPAPPDPPDLPDPPAPAAPASLPVSNQPVHVVRESVFTTPPEPSPMGTDMDETAEVQLVETMEQTTPTAEEPPVAAEIATVAEPEAPIPESSANEPEAAEPAYTCNICKDPMCPRRKGEPHNKCFHTKEFKR